MIVSRNSWSQIHKCILSEFSSGNWGVYNCFNHVDDILNKCGRYLCTIEINCPFYQKFDRSPLISIGKLCPNIKNINVNSIKVSKVGIKTISENCHSIQKFVLNHGFLRTSNKKVLDVELENLFYNNRNLSSIAVSNCIISGKCFLKLNPLIVTNIKLSVIVIHDQESFYKVSFNCILHF